MPTCALPVGKSGRRCQSCPALSVQCVALVLSTLTSVITGVRAAAYWNCMRRYAGATRAHGTTLAVESAVRRRRPRMPRGDAGRSGAWFPTVTSRSLRRAAGLSPRRLRACRRRSAGGGRRPPQLRRCRDGGAGGRAMAAAALSVTACEPSVRCGSRHGARQLCASAACTGRQGTRVG